MISALALDTAYIWTGAKSCFGNIMWWQDRACAIRCTCCFVLFFIWCISFSFHSTAIKLGLWNWQRNMCILNKRQHVPGRPNGFGRRGPSPTGTRVVIHLACKLRCIKLSAKRINVKCKKINAMDTCLYTVLLHFQKICLHKLWSC